MDKVIIDGIDVSECNFYRDKEHTKSMCKKSQNCYYKQLKRKEQEYEELKKQVEYDSRYNDMQAEIDCGEKIITNLKIENDDLRKILEKMSEDNITLKAEYERLNNDKNKYYQMTLDDEIQISNLIQENEKLKEEIEQHKKEKQILHERLYCYAYEKDCHIVCKQQNCILKNGYTYRNTLEEIKEMAELFNCTYENKDLDEFKKQIQDKISEVME